MSSIHGTPGGSDRNKALPVLPEPTPPSVHILSFVAERVRDLFPSSHPMLIEGSSTSLPWLEGFEPLAGSLLALHSESRTQGRTT
jgi:hypothetical protein